MSRLYYHLNMSSFMTNTTLQTNVSILQFLSGAYIFKQILKSQTHWLRHKIYHEDYMDHCITFLKIFSPPSLHSNICTRYRCEQYKKWWNGNTLNAWWPIIVIKKRCNIFLVDVWIINSMWKELKNLFLTWILTLGIDIQTI